MTALYRLGDAPSKKLVPTTQMRFGSITPAVEAMGYVRRREDAGDFSVVGFVQSATHQIVAEVSVPGHDEHHMLSVPLSGAEAVCAYMRDSADLGCGPEIIEADGTAVMTEILSGCHPEHIDAELIVFLHERAHRRPVSGTRTFADHLAETIVPRIDYERQGSARVDAAESAVSEFERAMLSTARPVACHGDLAPGNIVIRRKRAMLIDPMPYVAPFEFDLARVLLDEFVASVPDFPDAEVPRLGRAAKDHLDGLGLPSGLVDVSILVPALVGWACVRLVTYRRGKS